MSEFNLYAPKIQVGTTTTGDAGTEAKVELSGTEAQPVLNFTIPKGADGATGATGPQGETGASGSNGISPTVTSTGSTESGELAGTITGADGTEILVYNGAQGASGSSESEAYFKTIDMGFVFSESDDAAVSGTSPTPGIYTATECNLIGDLTNTEEIFILKPSHGTVSGLTNSYFTSSSISIPVVGNSNFFEGEYFFVNRFSGDDTAPSYMYNFIYNFGEGIVVITKLS